MLITPSQIANIINPRSSLEKHIINDPEWIEGANWGHPRPGHPEGPIIDHILEVLRNVDIYAGGDLNTRIYALIHDAFKHREKRIIDNYGRNVLSPTGQDHAIFATHYAQKLNLNPAQCMIIRWHDEADRTCKEASMRSPQETEYRFDQLFTRLSDEGILYEYVDFYRCDNDTGTKDGSRFLWTVNEIKKRDKTFKCPLYKKAV